MKFLATALIALLVPFAGQAQSLSFKLISIAPPADPAAIELWPRTSLTPAKMPETWARMVGNFGGRPVDARQVRNVAYPTITPVLPDPARATGAAVVVAPGGAFLSLSMDTEGWDVARWLADHGIAAFVLKYRVNATPADNTDFLKLVGARIGAAMATGDAGNDDDPDAVRDALQALKLVRADADRWRVDPARVGMIGFSAGAITALRSVVAGGPAGPAFVGYIYGPMVAMTVPAGAPPLFAALALDDSLFGRRGLGIVESWQKAGVPVELHAYERGEHGFGLGYPGTTTALLMPEFRAWLDARTLLGNAHR